MFYGSSGCGLGWRGAGSATGLVCASRLSISCGDSSPAIRTILANALGTSGTITLGGGTLQYGTGVTTDLSSRFSTAASQAFNIDTNGNNVTYASALTSSGGTLTKTGSGTLTLSRTNTYNGTTTISSGTLLLSSGGAGTPVLSTSSTIINNSTLAFDAPTFNVTYANTINGTGSVTHSMSVANRGVSLTGSNNYSAALLFRTMPCSR